MSPLDGLNSMPRFGATLIEQILARHAEVLGTARALALGAAAARRMVAPGGLAREDAVRGISPEPAVGAASATQVRQPPGRSRPPYPTLWARYGGRSMRVRR